jgi:hypothetical protein
LFFQSIQMKKRFALQITLADKNCLMVQYFNQHANFYAL